MHAFRNVKISLRTAIFVVFFLFSLIMIVGVLYIQFSREDESLNIMSERIIDTRGEAVRNALNYYIRVPQQANATASIFVKTLDAADGPVRLGLIGDYLYKIISQSFSSDSLLSSIAFGSASGNYIGFSRDLDTNWIFQIKKNEETQEKLVFYKDATSHSRILYSVDNYDLMTRPWFSQANKSRHSEWSSAYRDVNSESGVSISYSSPVTDRNGHYIGIISSDLRLSRLNKYLNNLTAAQHSLIYLVNDRGQIIAASNQTLLKGAANPVLAEQHGTDLPLVKESTVPVVKASAKFLNTNDGVINRIDIEGLRYYSKVIPVGDASSVRGWRMVVMVSENELLGKVSRYREMTILLACIVIALGGLLAHRILSVVVNPLRKIAAQAPDIARRRHIERNESWSFKEIVTLDNALNRMANDLDTAFARLEDQIHIDEETGLFTRQGLLAQYPAPRLFHGVVGMLSLTKLQTIANNLGKAYADIYLEAFIEFLYRSLPIDTVLARDSADRILICSPCSDDATIDIPSALLLNLMQQAESEYDGNRYVFMGHVGVVNCSEPIALDSAIANASIALQYARQQEGSTGCLYTDSLRESALNNITLLNHLYGAIANNELYLAFQPIVNLGSQQVNEAECLVRWNNPVLGQVRPDQFIQVAEESGYIIQLGRWIVNQACHELAEQIKAGALRQDFKLHVNASSVELAQPDFCDYVLNIIALHGLDAANISIEITETSMLKGDPELTRTLSSLRSAGVTIAIDDFGTGFSSLSYLHKFEFDMLKIDRDFVMDLLIDEKNASIISAVILIAKGFGVPLVAEGIETATVADKLIEMGCDKAQGYHFARPMRFKEWPKDYLARA